METPPATSTSPPVTVDDALGADTLVGYAPHVQEACFLVSLAHHGGERASTVGSHILDWARTRRVKRHFAGEDFGLATFIDDDPTGPRALFTLRAPGELVVHDTVLDTISADDHGEVRALFGEFPGIEIAHERNSNDLTVPLEALRTDRLKNYLQVVDHTLDQSQDGRGLQNRPSTPAAVHPSPASTTSRTDPRSPLV